MADQRSTHKYDSPFEVRQALERHCPKCGGLGKKKGVRCPDCGGKGQFREISSSSAAPIETGLGLGGASAQPDRSW